MRHTFKAYERLKREQHIDTLFRTGKAFSVFPLKIIYRLVNRDITELSPVRTGFSVSKKKFRKSVERNRIKRLMREAWRLHKAIVYNSVPAGQQLHLFLIYTGAELPEFADVEEVLKKLIDKLHKQISVS